VSFTTRIGQKTAFFIGSGKAFRVEISSFLWILFIKKEERKRKFDPEARKPYPINNIVRGALMRLFLVEILNSKHSPRFADEAG